jgi:PAS domain S-box-containing protein
MSSGIILLYVVTGVVSFVTAVILIRTARLTGQSRVAPVVAGAAKNVPQEESSQSQSLDEMIQAELKVLGEGDRSQVSQRVMAAVTKEMQRRIQEANKELSKKYEGIIDEKNHDQEIVWKKFHSVVEEKKQTEAVMRSVAEGLVVVGPDGKVIMMNPAAEKLLGVTKKDKIGKPITGDVRNDQLISLVKSGGEGRDKEIELASGEDETKKVLRASSAVIENENGQPIGMVSVLSDITKQKELDRMKSNFVTSVSHELRTPLVAVDKSLNLILSKAAGPLTDNQQQFLVIAQRNLKRLNRLIDDLLDLSKLEAGKVELKRQSLPIDRTVVETIETLDNWAKAKSVTLAKEVQEGIPPVYFDPDRITQVLSNLIGNAIKFTPQGGTITVGASLRAVDRTVEVTVRDTGIGISKENIPKLFDKFYQVGERSPVEISGTGIGLSIVKELVELHGGKIWVDSVKDKGTTFTFVLPLAQEG